MPEQDNMSDEERKLRKELHSCMVRMGTLRNERIKLKELKLEEVRLLQRKVEDELSAQFDKPMADAAHAEQVARLAVEWFEVGQTRERLVYPEGTILEEWDKPRYIREWKRTGNLGVVEVRTPDSTLPEHPGWKVPCVGGVGIRLLKKNGQPGLKLIASCWGTAWSVSGQDNPPIESIKLLRDTDDDIEL